MFVGGGSRLSPSYCLVTFHITQVPRMLRRLSPTAIELVTVAILVVLWIALGLFDLYRRHAP
jgi:hypothetical protein